jgi:hypothetical protein
MNNRQHNKTVVAAPSLALNAAATGLAKSRTPIGRIQLSFGAFLALLRWARVINPTGRLLTGSTVAQSRLNQRSISAQRRALSRGSHHGYSCAARAQKGGC